VVFDAAATWEVWEVKEMSGHWRRWKSAASEPVVRRAGGSQYSIANWGEKRAIKMAAFANLRKTAKARGWRSRALGA